MSDISSDSDDLCAKLSNEYDRFSVPDEFEDGWSREPAEMQDLKQICLEKMALDHVLKLHVDKVKDIPRDMFQELLGKVSVYGLDLLESHGIVAGDETKLLWNKQLDQLQSEFFPGRIQFCKVDDGYKTFFFQSLFSKMIELIKDRDLLPLRDGSKYRYHFSTILDPPSCRIFNHANSIWSQEHMKSLVSLFKSNLTRISIHPYLLHIIHNVLETEIMKGITESTKHVEFHDFFRFKDYHMWKIMDFFHPLNFPNLASLSFVCCKFNKEAIRDFESIIDNFINDGLAIVVEPPLDDSSVSPSKRAMSRDDIDNVQKQELSPKKPRNEDNSVSFDDALLCGSSFECSNVPASDFCDIYSFQKEPSDKVNDKVEEASSSLNCLKFVNCGISDKVINTLGKLISKVPNLRVLNLQPEYPLQSSLLKIFAASFGKLASHKGADNVKSSFQKLVVHDCHLDRHCKKLLFWHSRGDCKQQNGVLVPSLKQLDLIDCNLNTYQFDCCCNNVSESAHIESSFWGNGSSHSPEPSKTAECFNKYNWYFDPDVVCTCNWKRLQSVNLTESLLTFQGVQAILSALKTAENLSHLILAGCGLETDGCRSVFAMAAAHPSLQSLDVSDNSYSSSKDDSLEHLVHHGNLTSLALRNCISHGGLTDGLLSAFARNSKIASLDLGNNRLGNAGMEKISNILSEKASLSSLEVLCLDKNRIHVNGMKQFIFALQVSRRRLLSLRLSENAIDIAALRKLGLYDLLNDYVKSWTVSAIFQSSGDTEHVSEM